MIVTFNLSVTGEGAALVDAIAKMFASLGDKAVGVSIPPSPPAPVAAAKPPVVSLPAPPLSAEAQQKLAALEAQQKAVPPSDDPAIPQKRRGRPPGSGKKAAADDDLPVPRPESGFYGKATPPADPAEAAAWHEKRAWAKGELHKVLSYVASKGLDHEKFLNAIFTRFGDGKLSTVPTEHLDLVVEEARKGPKDHGPITDAHMAEGQAVIDAQRAHEAAGAAQ